MFHHRRQDGGGRAYSGTADGFGLHHLALSTVIATRFRLLQVFARTVADADSMKREISYQKEKSHQSC